MAIEILRTYPSITLIGDGSSKSVSIDFHEQIQSDVAIHNKTPTSIYAVSTNPAPSSFSLNGTVVTLNYASIFPSVADVQVSLLFPGQ